MQLNHFSPVVPDAGTILIINNVTAAYETLASAILNIGPASAHRTAALRKLLESKMTLIHGITHPQA